MGTVYRARDPTLLREVALKTISREVLARPDARGRFQREAQAAARLQHPNIVTIYELGEVDGLPFIAMELLEGLDLAEAMRSRERFTLLQLVKMVAEVCRGLDFAHKRGVVHRDVKPANIRVGLDGGVKLVDFGIARTKDSEMTQSGVVLGTPSYVAPEVLKTGRVDHRADMWAMGVLLYELLAGSRPFSGDISALIYQIVHEPHAALDGESLGFPPGLSGVVDRALEKQPGDRYRDLAEMAGAIETAAGLTGPLAPRLSEEARREAFAHNLSEAQRLLAGDRLEAALEAARRAQALDPSRTDVIGLVQQIEERIDATPTVVAPRPDTDPGAATGPAGAPTRPVLPADQISMSLRIRGQGAAAFREVAAFGKPPPSQLAELSPSRDHLATAGADGAVRIWDLRARVRVAELRSEMHRRTGHDAGIMALRYSPDGALIATGHVDGRVRLWDVASEAELPCRMKHDKMVSAVAFAPDGGVLASGALDSSLKLWDVQAVRQAGEARRTLFRQPAGVTALVYGDEGKWLASGHTNRVLRVLDAETMKLSATLRGPREPVSLLLGVGQRLIAASKDRTLRVFDVASREQVLELSTGARPVTAACISEAGDVLATVALDNCVHLWDLSSGAELAALWGGAGESFTGVATRGSTISVALADGRIRVWEAG